MRKYLTGDTVEIYWVHSGVTPSTILAYVHTGSETLVDSASMTSSGNGHYYHLHTVPNTPGWYVAETLATVGGKPYKRKMKYQAVIEDVD